MNKKKIGRTVLSLSGIAIFALILYMGGVDVITRVLKGDMRFLIATLIVIGGITLIGTLRWRLIVSALTGDPPLAIRQIYHYNILGRLISLFAPRGFGDFAGRPLALRTGVDSSLVIALYSTLLDRLFDYILMSILVIPSLLYATKIVSLTVGTLLCLFFIIISFFLIATRFGVVIRWVNKIVGKIAVWGNRVPFLSTVLSQERVTKFRKLEEIHVDIQTTANVYLLTIFQFSLIILRSYLAGQAMKLNLSYFLLLLASPIAQLGQLLAFTPGALGFREIGWYSVLQASGIQRKDLLTFLVGHRAYIYFSIIVLAALSQLLTLILPFPEKPTSKVVDPGRLDT